jgi:AcrR family transcriptional regulator
MIAESDDRPPPQPVQRQGDGPMVGDIDADAPVRAEAADPPAERADAARNRRKILEAASRIYAFQGAEGLSLDEVARTAGVGVGTVYRRFGSRAGLTFALLDDRVREFEQAFVAGPPPLGPGAPPTERIRAFLHALAELVVTQLDLVFIAETSSPLARYRSGPYLMHRDHLADLLGQLRPDDDTLYVADALLAPISSTLVAYQRQDCGIDIDRMKAGIDQLLGWCIDDPGRP